MKGDFSRLTFDATKHFSGVRMQQGRVQLDADWNEQLDITAHRIETEITDFVGVSGAPAAFNGVDTSFKVSVEGGKLIVGAGRYYVAGKLFENDAPNDAPYAVKDTKSLAAGEYYVYLDVWQQHVTALEDGSLREMALGGPDTATRIRNRWTVSLQAIANQDDPFKTPTDGQSVGEFRVGTDCAMRVKQDPAQMSIPGNRLYRVEIHGDIHGDGTKFKWDRDNGSVAGVATLGLDGTLTLKDAPTLNDRFAPDDLVEVAFRDSSTDGDLDVEPAWSALQRVVTVHDATLKLVDIEGETPLPSAVGNDVFVRRWNGLVGMRYCDQNQSEENQRDEKWIPLEHGIQVQFLQGTETNQPGDYWQFPVRVDGGDSQWPGEFQGPQGIKHAYVPLARVEKVDDDNPWQLSEPLDLRNKFEPLTTGLLSKTGKQKMTGPLFIGTPTDELGAYPTHALHIAGNNATLRLEGSEDNDDQQPTLSFGAFENNDETDTYIRQVYGNTLQVVAQDLYLGNDGVIIGTEDQNVADFRVKPSAINDGETLHGMRIAPEFDDAGHSNITHVALQVEQSIHIERSSETQTIVVYRYDFGDDIVGQPPNGFRVDNTTNESANNWAVVDSEEHGKCLRAGPTGSAGEGAGQTNYLYLDNVVISGKGSIQFDWHTETEENYDFFEFQITSIDTSSDFPTEQVSSGTADGRYYKELEPGTYNLRWDYTKDPDTDTGLDDVWIYKIEIKSVAPHISVGDLETGLFSLAENQLALVTGGKTMLSVASDGVKLIQEDWHEVPATDDWKHLYDVETEDAKYTKYERVAYFKDSQGFVHLKGSALSLAEKFETVFTFPSGYEPVRTMVFSAATGTMGGDGTYAEVGAMTTTAPVHIGLHGAHGVVVHGIPKGNWFSFDGISFRAAE